jgi:hypothetical protein
MPKTIAAAKPVTPAATAAGSGASGQTAANDAATPNPEPSPSSTGALVVLPLLLGGGLVGRRSRRDRRARAPDVRLWSP